MPPGRPVGQHVPLDAGLHRAVLVDRAHPHDVVALLDLGDAAPLHPGVVVVGTAAISAGVQSPPSTENSTPWMPVCCAHATPPKLTSPVATSAPDRGTSTRDEILTGPCSPQPRSVQYAEISSKLVTSMSTTHLHADT